MTPEELNLLIEQIYEKIPNDKWNDVQNKAIENIVDTMTIDVLFKIAELSLNEHYLENPNELIPDLIGFIGIDRTLSILNSLEIN